MGHSRRFDPRPAISGLPPINGHSSEPVGMSQTCQQRKSTIHIAMRRNVGFTSGPPQLLREVDMSQGQSIRDAIHLYEVERRVQHAARPGIRIMELQLSPTQKVPWHSHTNIMLLTNSPSVQRVPIDALKLSATPVRRHPKKGDRKSTEAAGDARSGPAGVGSAERRDHLLGGNLACVKGRWRD